MQLSVEIQSTLAKIHTQILEACPGAQLFLVGGCVRDSLMSIPPKDFDICCVGASPAIMDQRFPKVGKDFPVYLIEGCEIALARTERKTGAGYTGFVVECENVTIEEDLSRRDLTINAMAVRLLAGGNVGALIDPFGGRQDILDRKIRHVSAAFVEDPLRVMRVARFISRYGFSI